MRLRKKSIPTSKDSNKRQAYRKNFRTGYFAGTQWGDEITELVHAQNMFAWPVKIFQKQTLKNTTLVDYDKDKLQTQIDALDCMDADNQTAPENASVSSYDKTEGFTVVGCVMGTTIDAEKMYQAVQEAVEGLKENLSLEKAGVYEDPTVLDDDENLVKAVKKMNGYAKTKITFTVGDSKEVLDASVFGDWFRLNKKLKPVLDQECVKAYVSDLAKKYNTCYSAKTLKTSYGKTVTIPESHYGWKIDTEKEIAQITSEIKAGKAVERELNYSMTANSHGKNDYGDSYVEINLTAQHMFLYKDGKLVIDSDFVSGNVSKNNATPTGAYGVTYTEKNATCAEKTMRRRLHTGCLLREMSVCMMPTGAASSEEVFINMQDHMAASIFRRKSQR